MKSLVSNSSIRNSNRILEITGRIKTSKKLISTQTHSNPTTPPATLPPLTTPPSTSTFTSSTTSTPLLFTPSTHHFNDNNFFNNHNHNQISDHEYQLRLGRAVHLLRATLPDFPRLGLVDYSTSSNSNPNQNSHNVNNHSLDSMGFPGLALSSLLRRSNHSSIHGNTSNNPSWNALPINPSSSSSEGEDPSIYHPNIRFSYRPPNLSTETEQERQDRGPNLSFSGRTIYLASSQVLRHALNIVFTDLNVELERVQLVRSTSTSSSSRHSSDASGDPDASPPGVENHSILKNRNDELLIRLRLTALTRVTHSPHDYTVIFRYHFCQNTGLIKRHKVEKIQPAPGRKLWAVLSATILRLAGLHQQDPSPAPVHAHAHAQSNANLSGLPLPPSSDLRRR